MGLLRKGCQHCNNKLETIKEKITRTCTMCARKALEGFDRMSKGEFKEGMNDVLRVMHLVSEKDKEIVKGQMKAALTKKRKTIYRKLKKKGLTEEEIEKHMVSFDEFSKT